MRGGKDEGVEGREQRVVSVVARQRGCAPYISAAESLPSQKTYVGVREVTGGGGGRREEEEEQRSRGSCREMYYVCLGGALARPCTI